MNTASTIIIGIFTAAAATYLAYLLQSRRDARILWRNRNRFLYKLIQECSKLIEAETTHLTTWMASVKATNHDFPLVQQSSATKTVLSILADKVMLDEYYFAYNRLFSNYIKAEENYYNLQYAALHIKALYDQVILMINEGQLRNHQRETETLELFRQATELVNMRIQVCTPAELPYLQQFRAIQASYIMGRGNAFSANLTSIFQEYFVKIETVFNGGGQLPNELIPFGEIANKFAYSYNGIGFQNKNLAEDVEESIGAINESIIALENIKSYWREHLRKHLNDY